MSARLFASIPGTILWSLLFNALLFEGFPPSVSELFGFVILPAFATSLFVVFIFHSILLKEGILSKFWLPFLTIPVSAVLFGIFQSLPELSSKTHSFWEMPMVYLFWGSTAYSVITYPLAYINQIAASKLLILNSNKTEQEPIIATRENP